MTKLFNDINLDSQEEFIDIPDVVEDLTEEGTPAEKSKQQDISVGDDGMFEIPDLVNVSDAEDGEEIEVEDLDEIDSKETDESGAPPAKAKGSSSSSPFKPFVKALSEEGFLPSIEDEDFDALVEELGSESQALMELARRSIQEDVEDYKNNAETDFKAFMEARDKGYDLNEWADVYEAKKSYANITEADIDDDEDLQKNLVRQNLKYRGIGDDEIEDTIDAFETTGKLADNAKRAQRNLSKIAEQQEKKFETDKQAAKKIQQETREANIKTLRKEIDELAEPFPGIKINKQTKNKIFANITTPVSTGANGEPLNAVMVKRAEDPIKYAIYENLLLELGAFDGKLDKLLNKQKSKALSDLEKTLSSNKNTDFKGGKAAVNIPDDDIEFKLPKF